MAFFVAFNGTGKTHEGKNAVHDDDDGVHAGALPIAAAEMQPHAEFIEGQAHAEAVKQGGDVRGAADGASEHAETRDGGEQKDAVVEMMDMRSFEEEIHVRHQVGHDEEDEDARDEEGEEKADQRPAGEPVGGGTAHFMFGSHRSLISGIMREVERGEKGRMGGADYFAAV